MSKFLNTFPIESYRKAGYDYSSNGAYFITIKTQRMKTFFGEIVQTSNGMLQHKTEHQMEETCICTSERLSEIGLKAKENWISIPLHFPFVELGAFVIMPNHVHGILIINNGTKTELVPNQFKCMKGRVGTIINQYKGSVTRYANINKIEFGWHPGYHDKIIWCEKAMHQIQHYIQNNPTKWIQKNCQPILNKNEQHRDQAIVASGERSTRYIL